MHGVFPHLRSYRAAPVNDPDRSRYTEEMIDVAREAYRIAQTRNQEAVAEATGNLSAACASCFETVITLTVLC